MLGVQGFRDYPGWSVKEPDQWDNEKEADGHTSDQQMDLMIWDWISDLIQMI